MNLPNSPDHYSRSDQSNFRTAVAQADKQNLKRGQDIEVGRARLFMNSADGVRWQIVVGNDGTVYGLSGLTSPAIADDGDKQISADWTVEPGYNYVEADCSAGDVRITFDASNGTLEKKCSFRKSSSAHAMIINDGTTDIRTEPSETTVVYRRAHGALVRES